MVMKKSLLSIKRKPSMPDSSAGSTTQTRFHPVPPTPTSDDWVGDQNHPRRQTMRTTRSQNKVVTNVEKTKNGIERSIKGVRVIVPGIKVSDEGKPIVPPLGFAHVKNVVKNTKKGVFVSHCTGMTDDNGKGLSVQRSFGRMENTINMDALFGMKLKDNKKAVVEVFKQCKEKEVEVVTPINSAPPFRTKCNRNEFDGAKEALQSKPSTDPFPKNKKKKVLSKGSSRKFVMPYDFIDQQRAYFKEIDEYRLQVEEVEQVSVYEE
uniref:uncharacterized protein LOC122605377 n=1 Tax=Erigeron canadensis TaxID=72917 RepID=UPI001CB9399F|nr:uncharacterized protein LOC122605377 [Erigeron canadensis]